MSQMQAFYDKIASNSETQSKFGTIMDDADDFGSEATIEQLVLLAKDEGFDVSTDELKSFLKDMTNIKEGELSDSDLDQVAGGKASAGDIWNGAKTEWHWFSEEPASEAFPRWGRIIGGWF